jgi:hypothetical protein
MKGTVMKNNASKSKKKKEKTVSRPSQDGELHALVKRVVRFAYRQLGLAGAGMQVQITSPSDGDTVTLTADGQFTVTGKTINCDDNSDVATTSTLVAWDGSEDLLYDPDAEPDPTLPVDGEVDWTIEYTVTDDSFKDVVITLQAASFQTVNKADNRGGTAISITLVDPS